MTRYSDTASPRWTGIRAILFRFCYNTYLAEREEGAVDVGGLLQHLAGRLGVAQPLAARQVDEGHLAVPRVPEIRVLWQGQLQSRKLPIAASLPVLQPLAARQVHERDSPVLLCVPEVRVLQQISNMSFSVDPLVPLEQCAPGRRGALYVHLHVGVQGHSMGLRVDANVLHKFCAKIAHLGVGGAALHMDCHDGVRAAGLQVQLVAAHSPVRHAAADDLWFRGSNWGQSQCDRFQKTYRTSGWTPG